MKIGYACLTNGLSNTDFKTTTLKYASDERLKLIIEHNLSSLLNIIEYNNDNKIMMFRISSDIIPLASHEQMNIPWHIIYKERLQQIGQKLKEYGMRVSMHPGQYTVLNSNRSDVVDKAIKDLSYHNAFLDSLELDSTCKIILHVGGVYNDKHEAIARFIANYHKLNSKIKKRLVIENDDKSYTISDVLDISEIIDIPVVFDNLHHKINKSSLDLSDEQWLKLCSKTWKQKDGCQKIHYSQQAVNKKVGSHSRTINLREFAEYINTISDVDIMLEVKDKNLSAIKCCNLIFNNKIKYLEKEWEHYKYAVLEKSHRNYLAIRELLKDKNKYPIYDFYELIDEALNNEIVLSNSINSLEHVWGYLKNIVSDTEKKMMIKNIERYKIGSLSNKSIKNKVLILAVKYKVDYLVNSYYFYI